MQINVRPASDYFHLMKVNIKFSPDESQHKECVYTIKSTLHGSAIVFCNIPQIWSVSTKSQLSYVLLNMFLHTFFQCIIFVYLLLMCVELQNVSILTCDILHTVYYLYFF